MARRKSKQKKEDDTLVDIIEVRDQAQGFLDRYQNYILGGLIGIVLVVGGIFAYNNFYKKPRNQEAIEQMYQAQVQFERDSFANALTNPGGGYMGFLDIIDSYGGTKAGNLALYYTGISYLHLGQYEAAIDYLKDYNANGEITPIMKLGALGDAYAELEDFDNAMKYYKRAAKAEDNEILTPYYLKKIGMLYEKQGDLAEAKKYYEQIQKEYPESPDGQGIEKYIYRVTKAG